ncbi:MAG: 50S ribosomal protein L2 [Candidatus Spechtbacteria bacterium SB0662_bin_43]|uniref:Large ribosomal subunit protein uL2 n=1 Tax=Candidatus Spechtbacteria bacterium SB0662_bin_43 TaxID=2604897 RepID=A0A845DAM2_9BACT|nr:50S ribosomal protein L2 [Candidatus Spechtbacteria bacterium SB0662_bin_43]
MVRPVKPTTPGRRGMILPDFSTLTKKKPEKKLTKFIHRKKGRSKGKITVRHKGGGAKRKYRFVDFKQSTVGSLLKVLAVEYDPNRTARIALVANQHGRKSYILAGEETETGASVNVDTKAAFKKGNRMHLGNIPVGTLVYNIEMNPGRGGQIARSAGAYAKVLAHEKGRTMLRMPSTETRTVSSSGFATIGEVSNSSHREEVIGKAGRNRHKGKRPSVRGSAMNPVDHPHGGGEGKAPIGLKYPKTPWGKHALGKKTRKKKRYSNKDIIRRRVKKR